jgi:hypothetical protein
MAINEDLAAPEGAENEDLLLDDQNLAQDPDGDAEDDGEGGGDTEQPEEIEFDFGGNKLKVPKGAIPEDLASKIDQFTKGTWSDYTKKSGEVAEQRKALEAQAQSIQKLGTLRGEALSAYSQGLQLRQELEQLSKVDLNALWQSPHQEDRDRARAISDRYSQVQAQFQQAVGKVSHFEQEVAKQEAEQTARLMDEGRKKVASAIKDWSPQKEASLKEYAMKHGVSKEDADNWALNPFATIMVEKAMRLDALEAQAKKATKQPAPAQPVTAMKPKGAPTKSAVPSDDDSPEEWVRKRNAQLARKR